jgi:hypothetical protein
LIRLTWTIALREQRPALAALERQQRPQQRLAVGRVGRVGLGPPPARGRDRGGIDHVAIDPFLLQHPVQPEPVKARLMNGHGQSDPGTLLGLALEVCEPRQQAIDVAGLRLCCDIRSPLPGVNDVTNQLERLSSKETKLRQTGCG